MGSQLYQIPEMRKSKQVAEPPDRRQTCVFIFRGTAILCLLLACHTLFTLNTSLESARYSVLQTEGHDPRVDVEINLDGGYQYLKRDLESNWIE